jgi:hypothetical protein
VFRDKIIKYGEAAERPERCPREKQNPFFPKAPEVKMILKRALIGSRVVPEFRFK